MLIVLAPSHAIIGCQPPSKSPSSPALGVASTLAPYVERAAGDLTAAGAVDRSGCLIL